MQLVSDLGTVLLADIDSETMMQSRILAAFASGMFALVTYAFDVLLAQNGKSLGGLKHADSRQSLVNIQEHELFDS